MRGCDLHDGGGMSFGMIVPPAATVAVTAAVAAVGFGVCKRFLRVGIALGSRGAGAIHSRITSDQTISDDRYTAPPNPLHNTLH